MTVYLQRLTVILIAMMMSATALAGMYKWTDPSGQVHYTDSPPPDQDAKALDPRTAVPTGAEQEKTQFDKQMEEYNKRREEEQKQEEQAKKAELLKQQRAEQCATLRNNLQLYLNRRRVAKNVNGETVEVPYEEQLKEIEKIQEQMKKVCDNS